MSIEKQVERGPAPDVEFMMLEIDVAPFAPDSRDSQIAVLLFGVTAEGKSVVLLIPQVSLRFYVQTGDGWGESELEAWTEELLRDLREKNRNYEVQTSLCKYEQLYGFTNELKSQYVCLEFSTLFAYKAALKILQDVVTMLRGRTVPPDESARTPRA